LNWLNNAMVIKRYYSVFCINAQNFDVILNLTRSQQVCFVLLTRLGGIRHFE